MMKEIYRQVELEKQNKNSIQVQTTWIPEKFAVEGKFLKLRERGEVWDDGWEVIYVGAELDYETLTSKGRSQKWFGNDSVRVNGVWTPIG